MSDENNTDFTVCEGLVIKAAKIRTAIDKAAEASLELQRITLLVLSTKRICMIKLLLNLHMVLFTHPKR